jgi:NAD/NADP transhydrogenase beta subunit
MCVVTAVVALRSGDLLLARRVTMWLAAMGVVALVVARAGREFYGRPTPAVAGYVSFAIGVTVAVWALYRFLVRPTDYSWLAALVIGVAAAAEAAALLSMLYRPIVLAVFPAWFERACVALAFGAGVAATVLCVFAGLADTTQATEPKAEVRYAPL